jgi:hypothetical protein
MISMHHCLSGVYPEREGILCVQLNLIDIFMEPLRGSGKIPYLCCYD